MSGLAQTQTAPEVELDWSEFASVNDDPEDYIGTWSGGLVQQLRLTKAREKSACPLVKLATFGKNRNGRKSLRNNANVTSIHGIEGDYDAEVMTIEQARARLEEAGVKAVLYPTPSNLPGKPRWRVLCPTSSPLDPAKREGLVARLNGALGGVLAGESFTLSQIYYYGDVGTNDYRVIEIDGAFIDTMDHLDARAIGKQGVTPQPKPDKPGAAVTAEPLMIVQVSRQTLDDLGSALAHIPSDDRDLWQRLLHALKTLGEPGKTLALEWSRKSDKFDTLDFERVWLSLNPTATGHAAVFAEAQRRGWKNPNAGNGAIEQPRAKLAPVSNGTDVAGLFNDLVLTSEDVSKMADADFLVPNLIVRGHVAAIAAPGNGGKTTIMIHECEKMAARGLQVLYINVDGSPSDLKRQQAHAQTHCYRVIAPDAKAGKSTEDVVAIFQSIASGSADCGNIVIVIDTLKKFLNVIQKAEAKEFYKLMRSITVKGATVVLLAHTNKYAGEDGKQIFEGTADLRNDLDELIYFDSFKNEANNTLEVTTRPDKVRAEFAPKSYTVHLPDRSVTEPDVVINILAKDDREILNLAKDAINSGLHSQKELIEYVVSRTAHGAKKVRNSLLASAKSAIPEIISTRTGEGRELRYTVAPTLAQALGGLKT